MTTDPDLETAREIIYGEFVLDEHVKVWVRQNGDINRTLIPKLIEKIAQALKEARKRQAEADAKIAEDYDHYKTNCLAQGHTDRWCAYCSAINDNADIIAAKIRGLK